MTVYHSNHVENPLNLVCPSCGEPAVLEELTQNPLTREWEGETSVYFDLSVEPAHSSLLPCSKQNGESNV